MDLGRLRGTDYVVGALAAALLASLFLAWYEPLEGALFDATRGGEGVAVATGASLNAWEAYAATDVVLALFAAMGLALVAATATQRTAAVAVALGSLTAAVSLFATGFMVVAALTVPGEGLVREIGPVLGLALTLALAGAVWSTLRSERPGPALARSPRAEVETLPTPEP